MKKLLSLTLVICMLLALCACGKKTADESVQTSTTGCIEPASNLFQVGFGRADITPSTSVSLQGYFDLRASTGVLNKLYATCVALSDGSNTVLLYTVDIIDVSDSAEKYIDMVSEATGIPVSNIMASGTHTHSGPCNETDYTYWENQFYPAMVQAAKDAIADLGPVQILAGETRTDRMNFVRHYTTANGVIIGDNFGDPEENGGITGHATEADNQMQLIRFVREDKKDILMINWQGHPKAVSTAETVEGQTHRTFISSDYIGLLRDNLEAEQADLQIAFYLGASGNLNVRSRLKSEWVNAAENFITYGKNLTKMVSDALPSLQPIEMAQAAVNNQKQELSPMNKRGTTPVTCTVSAVVAGELSFVAVPYEMFDTNGMYVKENAPTKYTFIMTCADGHIGYVPSDYAYDYSSDCYEVSSSMLGKGEAEKLAAQMVTMLNTLAGK